MASSNPLVTIGMPVYNGAKYVARALDCLIRQEYRKFELLISDNASTDATVHICREYAARDPRISLHRNRENIGAVANFGQLVRMARGTYFMWAAVDDRWHPSFLSTVVRELERYPAAGLAMCAVDRISEDGKLFDTIRFVGPDDPHQKQHLNLCLAVTSPRKRKYNLFIYGLYRTDLVRQAYLSFPDILIADRLFIALLALVTRFRYVDRVLHTRQHSSAPYVVRNPADRSHFPEGLSADIQAVLALGKMIWQSPLVPWQRKFYAPAGMANLAALLLKLRYRTVVRRNLSDFWSMRGPKLRVG